MDTIVLSVRVRKALRWHLNRAAKAAGQKQADYLRSIIERAVKPAASDLPTDTAVVHPEKRSSESAGA